MSTKNRNIIELGFLIQEIITELRNFESKFSTKILTIHNYWTNNSLIERELEFASNKFLKAECGLYMDDNELTNLYPFIIQDHMFFL